MEVLRPHVQSVLSGVQYFRGNFNATKLTVQLLLGRFMCYHGALIAGWGRGEAAVQKRSKELKGWIVEKVLFYYLFI
jgi:hypothetical protein